METKTKEIEKGFTFKEDGHKYFFDGKPLTGITTILNVIAKPFLIQWAANMATETIKRKWEMGKLYTQEEFDATLEEARLAHRKKKETAGELGTDIHSQIEEIIKEAIKIDGKIPPILKTLSKLPGNEQINHFVNWAVENKVKFLDSEVRIYSKELFLGGTCDFVCEIEKEIWIGDIKTGNGIGIRTKVVVFDSEKIGSLSNSNSGLRSGGGKKSIRHFVTNSNNSFFTRS